MKPVKRSVALVLRDDRGRFLVVKRPDDPEDPLAGIWGLPAITLREGEAEVAAASRAGIAKLGVTVSVGRKIGSKTADREGYVLSLSDYEATIAHGTPAVPQPDVSMTQYVACRFVSDPAVLAEAAGRGSVCAQVFLECQCGSLACGHGCHLDSRPLARRHVLGRGRPRSPGGRPPHAPAHAARHGVSR